MGRTVQISSTKTADGCPEVDRGACTSRMPLHIHLQKPRLCWLHSLVRACYAMDRTRFTRNQTYSSVELLLPRGVRKEEETIYGTRWYRRTLHSHRRCTARGR